MENQIILIKVSMINGLLQGDECHIKNVSKVAPGEYHTNKLREQDNRNKNLWNGFLVEKRPLDIEEFKEKLIESIRKIAKTKQKVGLFLSGGLDSTMVLSVVKDLGLDLTVYICGYDEQKARYWNIMLLVQNQN